MKIKQWPITALVVLGLAFATAWIIVTSFHGLGTSPSKIASPIEPTPAGKPGAEKTPKSVTNKPTFDIKASRQPRKKPPPQRDNPTPPDERWIDSEEEVVPVPNAQAGNDKANDEKVKEAIEILSLPWNTKEKAKLDGASRRLANMGSPAIEPLRNEFFRKNKAFAFRQRAIDVLGEIGAKDALREIALDTEHDLELKLRQNAARALVPSLSKRSELEVLLNHKEPWIRFTALKALANFPLDATTLKYVEREFESKHILTRIACADILANDPQSDYGEEKARMLAEAIGNAGSIADARSGAYGSYRTLEEELLLQYLLALARMKGVDKALLKESRRAADSNTRAILTLARARRGDESSKPGVEKILKSGASGVFRTWAAESLGVIGSREDISLLQSIGERDKFERLDHGRVVYPVRMAVKRSIRKIESKNAKN